MIYAFTGKTGSGKTYQMVRTIYKEWRHGRDVYSNTVLFFLPDPSDRGGFTILDRPEQFSFLEHAVYWIKKTILKRPRANEGHKRGHIFYFESINEILHVEDGVVAFDEAQVLFNARLWESLPDEFQYKLQQHRKHRLDLYCTTQNLGTIDITYRRLIQWWGHCRETLALFGIRNPSLLSWHSYEIKDIDYLYNTVDDLQVPSIGSETFFISRFSKRLYDTFYDIGFKRFKTLWVSFHDRTKNKMERQWLVIPKKMSLKDAWSEISSYERAFGLNSSTTLRKSWNRS
jgi:hypothetical protein